MMKKYAPPIETGVGGHFTGRAMLGGKAQMLKPRDMRRVSRHALPAFTRATQYKFEADAMWNHRWRKMAIFDVCFAAAVIGWIVILVGVILRAG